MAETDYPKKGSSGNRTTVGYTVEAKCNYSEPTEVAGQLFDNRWRQVHFRKAPIGVPRGSSYYLEIYEKCDLVSYQAAQALRWWLHAIAEAGSGGGLETKLIQHKVESSFSCEALSEHKIISGEDRSSCMPDWGEDNGD